MKKTIGILGGMGPLATADLFQKITILTKATMDQEHIHVLVDSNTAIPDRTDAILHGAESPLPQMVQSAKRLEAMGADFLVMPCNTAHFFYDDVASSVRIPMLHMIREAAKEVKALGFQRSALLSTTGAVESGIYQRVFREEQGVQGRDPWSSNLLLPSKEGQQALMDMIYRGVKAAKETWDVTALRKELDGLMAQGAEEFILGCTELPLAFRLYQLDYPALDVTMVLARQAVLFAGGEIAVSAGV